MGIVIAKVRTGNTGKCSGTEETSQCDYGSRYETDVGRVGSTMLTLAYRELNQVGRFQLSIGFQKTQI